eukprot:gene10873-16995_t
MPKPDTKGRYEILELHLRTKQVAADVDLMQLARDLPGLVGADLSNIVNEAQLSAPSTCSRGLTGEIRERSVPHCPRATSYLSCSSLPRKSAWP